MEDWTEIGELLSKPFDEENSENKNQDESAKNEDTNENPLNEPGKIKNTSQNHENDKTGVGSNPEDEALSEIRNINQDESAKNEDTNENPLNEPGKIKNTSQNHENDKTGVGSNPEDEALSEIRNINQDESAKNEDTNENPLNEPGKIKNTSQNHENDKTGVGSNPEDEALSEIRNINQNESAKNVPSDGNSNKLDAPVNNGNTKIKFCTNYSSSEDEVLSKVKEKMVKESLQQPIAIRKKKRTVKRKKYSSEEEDSNDSVMDPDFKISKKEDLATESNVCGIQGKKRKKTSQSRDKQLQFLKKSKITKDHTVQKSAHVLKTKKTIVSQNTARDKGWKKKPTILSKKKKVTPGRPNSTTNTLNAKKKLFASPIKQMPKTPKGSILNEVKQRSLVAFRARQLIYKIHTRNLDTLLQSNGLIRHEIQGDGNCFFAAVCKAEGNDPSELRNKICDHLEHYSEEYRNFLTSVDGQTEDEINNVYKEQVRYLREDGHWSANLADALPLAAANMLEKELMIYSSARNRPILKIQPTISASVAVEHISVAHIAVPGLEHYDACIKPTKRCTVSQSTENVTSQGQPQTPAKNQDDPSENVTVPTAITPRKQAQYKSPKRKFRSRKRIAKPDTWKKNVRTTLKISGKEYTNTSGKVVRERNIQIQDCTKCRFKCSKKISEENRKELFTNYWNLNDYNRQKDFICSTVKECAPERIRPSAKRPRKLTRVFSFNKNGEYVRVCKHFYIKTLDIGEKTMESALKSSKSGTFVSRDKRGRHSPHNKTPRETLNHIRRHIESFPVMDPHYTRKDTNRQFLGSDLNITKMYELYKAECRKENKKPVSSTKYRRIFCEEYNYSFHTPKKDQCRVCNLYLEKQANGRLKNSDIEAYEQHIQRKLKAREEKTSDKNYSKLQLDYHTATFDLQAVLHCPCSNVSQVYYKRKLNCYNSSFYSLGDGKGTCFMWNETDGKRGSNEIGTCIVTYLKSLPPTTSHVCLYSDNCAGQNRNRFVSTAILHAVITIENILTVDQKFLESGHTEMECDSMHAAIEAAKKNTPIYIPCQWDTIVFAARKRKPYTVVPIRYSDILNFREIGNKLFSSTAVDNTGKKVKWLQIKWIRFRKEDPDCMFYKYEYDEEDFHSVRIKTTSRRAGVLHIAETVPKCYKDKIPISAQKKKDLLSLCEDGTIPQEHLPYYKNLKCDSGIKDILPEPDLYDEEEDTDCELDA